MIAPREHVLGVNLGRPCGPGSRTASGTIPAPWVGATGSRGSRLSGNSARLRPQGGAPSRIRTCDLRIRSPTLYPTELWARPTAPEEWRRGRDSNPGPGSTPGNRLAGGCLRPTRPPLRAQRSILPGGPNLCQLSEPSWDGWRRGRDSNPRGLAPIPVFKTGAFNRSATPPVSILRELLGGDHPARAQEVVRIGANPDVPGDREPAHDAIAVQHDRRGRGTSRPSGPPPARIRPYRRATARSQSARSR
jgi:hypothetical protein